MTIHGIGPIDPVSKLNTTNRTNKTSRTEGKDSISVSSEAKSMSEVYQASESVKSAPDIRMDRVAEVKEKLKDPNYINEKVLESVAENIMDAFGI